MQVVRHPSSHKNHQQSLQAAVADKGTMTKRAGFVGAKGPLLFHHLHFSNCLQTVDVPPLLLLWLVAQRIHTTTNC